MVAPSRAVGIAVFVASLIAVGLAAITSIQTRDNARCQANYNEINNERTRILTDVGAREREAERRRDDALDAAFLDPSILKPAEDRTAAERLRVTKLFTEYLAAARAVAVERTAADKARAANPVPQPPSELC